MANQDQRERNRPTESRDPDALARRDPHRVSRREDPREMTDPFRTIRRMFDQFDRWPFVSPPSGLFGNRRGLLSGWTPQIDTVQRGEEFVVRADLPGMEKKDVTVEIQDGALVIQGERIDEREEKDDAYFTSERTYGQFSRLVPLPEGAAPDTVKATFKNGVLEVTMRAPAHQSRGRRIEISDGGR